VHLGSGSRRVRRRRVPARGDNGSGVTGSARRAARAWVRPDRAGRPES